MKQLILGTKARLVLAMIVGSQRGTVADIVILSRILGKVELTPAEQADIKLVQDGLQVRWDAAKASDKQLELTAEEAKRLAKDIRAWQQFTAVDAEWVSDLLTSLE